MASRGTADDTLEQAQLPGRLGPRHEFAAAPRAWWGWTGQVSSSAAPRVTDEGEGPCPPGSRTWPRGGGRGADGGADGPALAAAAPPCPPRTAATAPAPPPELGHSVVRVTHSDPVRAEDVSATRGFLGRSSSVSSWFRLWLSDTFDPFQCTRCTKIERTRLVGVGDPSGRRPRRKRPVSHPRWLRGVLPSAHFLLIRSADSVLWRVAFARRPQRPHRRQLRDTSSLGCSSPAPRSAYAAQSPMACLRDERPQTVLSDPRS